MHHSRIRKHADSAGTDRQAHTPELRPALAHKPQGPQAGPRANSALGNLALQQLRRGTLAGRSLSSPGERNEIQAAQTADRILAMSPPASAAPLQPASGPARTDGNGQGQPLPAGVRNYFEPRFGTSFEHVRIRHDAAAANDALALDARAYTADNVITFARDQYDPHSTCGLHLLAHELAHINQAAEPGTDPNRIHRETWDIDDASRTVERGFLVELDFEDTYVDHLLGRGWTQDRRNTFRSEFESAIETTFNNNSFVLRPPESYADVLPAENIAQGYKPQLDIVLTPDGSFSFGEDWEVTVSSNPTGEFRTSSSNRSTATMDEADNAAITKSSSAPGVTQIPSVHEFGHFIGLHHPGRGIPAAERSPAGGSEYTHSGTDEHGHAVDGPNDLLGGGMGLRPFYFDEWAQALDRHVAALRREQAIENFRRSFEDIFFPRPPMGDFPELPRGDTQMA